MLNGTVCSLGPAPTAKPWASPVRPTWSASRMNTAATNNDDSSVWSRYVLANVVIVYLSQFNRGAIKDDFSILQDEKTCMNVAHHRAIRRLHVLAFRIIVVGSQHESILQAMADQ